MRAAIVNWARDEHDLSTVGAAVVAAMPVPGAVAWATGRGGREVVQSVRASAERDSRPRQSNPLTLTAAWWATPALVDQIEGAVRAQHVAGDRGLLDVEVTAADYLQAPGVNDTLEVTFADGTTGFHKSFAGLDDDCAADYGQDSSQQPIHEVAASLLAARLGKPWALLVPACVLRVVDGRLGSLVRGVSGMPLSLTGVAERQLADAAFFDALIANQDRHPGNWLNDNGTMHLIDHGFSFARPGDYTNFRMLQDRRTSSAPGLEDHERNALRRLLDSPDAFGLDGCLEAERVHALRRRARLMLATNQIVRQW